MLRDCGLALVFAIAHSVMLVPKTRRILTRTIPAPFYDTTFCVVTCVSLLALFFCWRQSPTVIWEVDGGIQACVRVLFYVSWAALFYSLALTGLGYQNGWTPFYYWLRHEPAPRREFRPHGAYNLIRHPVYLSFLGLIWFTPRMSLDHAVLTLVWTAYIFYGSVLKDRRLAFLIGKAYVDYQRRVPRLSIGDDWSAGTSTTRTRSAGCVPMWHGSRTRNCIDTDSRVSHQDSGTSNQDGTFRRQLQRFRLVVVYGLLLAPWVAIGVVGASNRRSILPWTGSTQASNRELTTTVSVLALAPEILSSSVGPAAPSTNARSMTSCVRYKNLPASITMASGYFAGYFQDVKPTFH